MVLIDNGWSAVPMVGVEGENLWIRLKNMTFYGETEARDCWGPNVCGAYSGYVGCWEKYALMVSMFSAYSQAPLIQGFPAWP